ncbi:cathepsin B isoform X2 [Acyrthosiphon pisum]|nr:cathepsin B isoform X2 [Acyrthosiphon pisum]|eukprot:XP_008187496.1 PREDICTED: cathepsin B-like isoform X2 [Acyrthosiphon pisum]
MIANSDIKTNTLKSVENFGPNSGEEENIMMLLGTRGVEAATKSKKPYKIRNPRYVIDNQNHKEFDARKRWPQCKTIGEVYNEGNALLSWAYATTGVFADRMCIATNGSYNKHLSTEELISCSGIKASANGWVRDGLAWEYFKTHGLVSGGSIYNTNDGCQPSKIPPVCNLPTKINKRTCVDYCYGNDTIKYNHDHVKVRYYYHVKPKDIQKEVQTYGPVTAALNLYDDIFLHKSGVYTLTKNAKYVRLQYVKLIGWGVENGVDYWLLVNSWGNEWGQNGLLKIKRGKYGCAVESFVYAAVPKIK